MYIEHLDGPLVACISNIWLGTESIVEVMFQDISGCMVTWKGGGGGGVTAG